MALYDDDTFVGHHHVATNVMRFSRQFMKELKVVGDNARNRFASVMQQSVVMAASESDPITRLVNSKRGTRIKSMSERRTVSAWLFGSPTPKRPRTNASPFQRRSSISGENSRIVGSATILSPSARRNSKSSNRGSFARFAKPATTRLC
ncbi:MAG: hypothetical protein R3A47_01085 [Polyangiales bacterium]